MKLIKPTLFIGSSNEYYHIARKIKRIIGNHAIVTDWKQFYPLGESTLESLLTRAELFDFAIFLFMPDDQITSRNEKKYTTRDNVTLEFGLFASALGRYRTFPIKDSSLKNKMKMPSDLGGITISIFNKDKPELESELKKACRKIIATIKELGPRDRTKNHLIDVIDHFNYGKYLESIKGCTNKLRIFHSYVYPFVKESRYGKFGDKIIRVINNIISTNQNIKIEFLFLNPYSSGMELRVRDKHSINKDIDEKLLSMYGFFYRLRNDQKYKRLAKRLSIRVYDQSPPFAMFQIDTVISMSVFLKGQPIYANKWIIINSESIYGKWIRAIFNKINHDADTFEIEYCFFIEINGKKYHYVKDGNNFYIGIKYLKPRGVDNNLEMQISWFGNLMNGDIEKVNIISQRIRKVFEKKFPGELFKEFYLFKSKTKNIFSTNKSLTF